jgi:phosphatidylglycerophosphate synthase
MIAAAVVIVASLIFDGLDGAVAVLRERESDWGAVLDSFLDRIAEAFWAGALVAVGVPVPLAVAAWIIAMVQEYERARFGSLDRSAEPITVSVCERPVRALLIAAAVLMGHAGLPFNDIITPTVFAAIWLLLQSIGALQVWRASSSLR